MLAELGSRGDNDRAIADFNQAITRDPKSANTYNNRGIAYQLNGDNARAIDDFNQVIRLAPKLAEPYNNRGEAYKSNGDFDKAIADLTEAITLNPNYAHAYRKRGWAFQSKGDNARAIDDFNQAITLDPKSASVYFGRGLSNLYMGRASQALADLHQSSGHTFARAKRDAARDVTPANTNTIGELGGRREEGYWAGLHHSVDSFVVGRLAPGSQRPPLEDSMDPPVAVGRQLGDDRLDLGHELLVR